MASDSSDSTVIGIDLGTTNSCVAVWRNGAVEIIDNDQGNRLTPSMVAFTEIECLVGDGAKAQMIQNATNTVFGIKRIMGQKFHEKSLQEDIKMWSCNVVCEDDKPKIEVMYQKNRKTFAPEVISSKILLKMKEAAEARLEHEVTDAVITVPAYFNDSQRKATIDAGKIAGLNVLRILNEPTAAAIAYGMDKKVGRARNVLVFDLGGGTFDVSIMTIEDGNFTVKAVDGDTHLGGEDFDRRLVEYLMKDFKRKHKKDISKDKKALSKLRIQCELVKRRLSLEKAVNIYIDALHDGIDLQSNMTRNRFEDLNMELFTKTIQTVENALREAKMKKSDIDDVVLVGGSTRIPKIQDLLQDFFDGRKLSHGINPDEAVANGAAILAASLQGNKSEAIQNLHLYDVTPLSLGIEIYRGLTEELIKRNTTIPAKYTKPFATCADNQVAASINVYEGERPMFKDNNLLGSFFLRGLPAEQKGGVTVDVTFDIDANGMLTVSAVEKNSGIENQIQITNTQGRLTQEEIKRMVKEAEKYKADDEQKRSLALNKTNLEECISNIEHDIEEKYMTMITTADKNKILDRCKMITNWLKTDQLHDDREYQNREEELKQMWAPILRKLGGFYNNTSIM